MTSYRNYSRRRVLVLCVSLLLQPRVLVSLGLSLLSTVTVLLLWSNFGAGVDSVRDYQTRNQVERNYGVVIDAGSSSSKLHLFHWPSHDGDPAKLLTIKPLMDELGDPLTRKVEPGISTFAETPETAYTSLQPLLDFALAHIPPSHYQHTSLYIFGTAGMRFLSEQDQQKIIKVLKERVTLDYPFHLPRDGIQVISGKLEGVFSWIAVNYLVGRLSPESHHHHQQQQQKEFQGSRSSESSSGGSELHPINTVGSLDMGGASLQVTFEVPTDITISPDLTVDINLGCGVAGSDHKHRIFVNTYLGYGTNEARSRYYQHLLRTHLNTSNETQHPDSVTHLHSIRDPCAPLDSTDNITVDGHYIKIRGLGDFGGCKKALFPLLQATNVRNQSSRAPCTHSGCSNDKIQNFQRPSLPLKYEAQDFYGTSEFWYTMRDVLSIGGHYTAYSYEKASSEYCQTSWKTLLDRFLKRLYFYANFHRLKSQCMKSAWLSLILHEGLGFPKDTISLHSVATIRGQSVQWPLGALVYNTRYLPLREVQLQQLQIPLQSPPQSLSYLLHSSFLLPMLTVLLVIILLLLLSCRHRRTRLHPSTPISPNPHSFHHRTQSLNSLLPVHRRCSSYSSALASFAPPASEGSNNSAAVMDDSGQTLKFIV